MDRFYSNITILTIENNIFTTLVSNNYNLRKEDFITKLLQFFINNFEEQTDINLNLNKYHKAIKRLRKECKSCIDQLCIFKEYTIDLDQLAGGEDFLIEITRAGLEGLCEDLFKKIIINIENTLEISKLNKYEIEYIIFEGRLLYC